MLSLKLNLQKKFLLFAALLISVFDLSATRPAKPNFILILADDLGWQDVKVYDTQAPFSVFETPNMDALAGAGVRFTNGYSPTPVCAPSRVAIMTGKHPARVDVTSVSGGKCPKAGSATTSTITPHYRSSLRDEEISLAEALKEIGYFTGVFGKWHMSPDGHHFTFPLPTDQGFDRAYNGRGVQSGMNRLSDFATSDPGDTYQLDANGIAKDPVTEEALGFFAEAVAQGDPFFCYYSTWLVHGPWQVRTESLLQKYAGLMGYSYPLDGSEVFAEGQENPYYAAMVESLDYYIGLLIDYLEVTDDPRWPGHKLIENTYIVLSSDNGGMETGDANGFVTDNYPLDKGKIWIKEGGVRVPFIVRGPDIATNAVSDVVVNGMDLYPTFLSLAGQTIPDRLEGCDLSDLLLNDLSDASRLQHHQTGATRDSMYWHFPHSGRVASTLLKDGWKLYKNYDHLFNDWGPYSLYRLYDGNGTAVDPGESSDLINSQGAVASGMITEIENWIREVDARPQYLNPLKGTLPLVQRSPKILATGNDDTMAWVSWNTNRAHVKYLDLLYTKSASGSNTEEWFKIPVPFDHKRGWAEVAIPDGAESFFFYLVDENNFFVSSVDLTGHSGYDSELVPLRSWNPSGTATIADAGTSFPASEVLFSNSVDGGTFSAVRDDGANLQVLGQTFTVTDPVKLTSLSLKAYTNFTVGSAADNQYYLWIGKYTDGAPLNAPRRTRLYQEVDLRGLPCTAGNYYTIDFEDVRLTPGTYAFQLKWKAQVGGNSSYWSRANGGGEYSGGDRIHILTAAGSTLDFPFSQTESSNSDLVFALHGSEDAYGGWVAANHLDRAPQDPYRNGIHNDGGLRTNSVFFSKTSASAWSVSNGVLSNSSLSNNNTGEGAVAKVIDLQALELSDAAQITLNFDYTTSDANEVLYVHLWGCKDNGASESYNLINLGAQNGNAWTPNSAADNLDFYNLAKANGAFTGTPGSASDAALILTGGSGAQSYSGSFDLSGFTTAPNTVAGYDYLILAFAREIGGAATPAVSITNLELGLSSGTKLFSFPRQATSDDSYSADADRDGRSNLMEFAVGGDPNSMNDGAVIPTITKNGSSFQFVYRRRLNAAANGLNYSVKRSTSLESGSWSTNGISEAAASPVDASYENVTTNIESAEKVFVRLEVETSQ